MTSRNQVGPVDTAMFADAAARCAEGRADLVRCGRSPEGRKHLRRFSLNEVGRWLVAMEPAALRAALDADPSLPQGTRDGDVVLLRENESIYLPLGCVHRLANPGKVPVEIIEVQTGAYLEEDDIVRLEDDFGGR